MLYRTPDKRNAVIFFAIAFCISFAFVMYLEFSYTAFYSSVAGALNQPKPPIPRIKQQPHTRLKQEKQVVHKPTVKPVTPVNQQVDSGKTVQENLGENLQVGE